MKHREYRKIIVNDKEYDWLYVANYEWDSCIKLFEVSYVKHNTRKWKKDIRKRKLIKEFNIPDYIMQITPKVIRYGPSGSTNISTFNYKDFYHDTYTIYGDNKYPIRLTPSFLSEFFYTIRELRKLKIKKIEHGV